MMKQERFEDLISRSINEKAVDVDFKSEIMNKIDSRNIRPIRLIVRRTFMLVALFILTSSIIFAGVHTLIELKNDDNEVIGTVEVIETDENQHLDAHISREEFIRYGDKMHSDPAWEGKSFVVIDTMLDLGSNVDLRPKSEHVRFYDQVLLKDGIVLLPESIDSFEFSGLSIGYSAEFPDKDVIETIIKENPDERFIVKEVETGPMKWVAYSYKSDEIDLEFSIWIEIGDAENAFSYITSTLENYEVFKLNDIEGFLSETKYLGVTYEADRTTRIVGENHFRSAWYEPEIECRVSIKPRLPYIKNRVHEEIDGEMVYLEVYPENTSDIVKELSLLVHELLNK